MRILGPPTATLSAIRNGLDRWGTTDLMLNVMAPTIWAASRRYSVDPVGAIAQAVKETNWGRFGGRIDARWMNTCGLKIRDLSIVPGSETNSDLPLCHASFGSWEIGARAHVQHLVAYAGGVVETGDLVDPRYVWVAGRHTVEHFSGLGGKWAPSPTYGQEIEHLATKILGA